jgi:hypothetical protein
VVADEIRKLAENSGGQSKTISAALKKMNLPALKGGVLDPIANKGFD